MSAGDEPLSLLLAQEKRLVFPAFDTQTAWDLGVQLRTQALTDQLPLAIAIRSRGQLLFHSALPGSTAENDSWLRRKAAVVDRYGHSSYYVGCKFRSGGGDFETDSGLDLLEFAAHGGAFPIMTTTSGCVGSVAVSGLPQIEDHRFVVHQLEIFLARNH